MVCGEGICVMVCVCRNPAQLSPPLKTQLGSRGRARISHASGTSRGAHAHAHTDTGFSLLHVLLLQHGSGCPGSGVRAPAFRIRDACVHACVRACVRVGSPQPAHPARSPRSCRGSNGPGTDPSCSPLLREHPSRFSHSCTTHANVRARVITRLRRRA